MPTNGEKIKKLREIRGYSQEFMAVKLKISQEQYSYLENKQKNIPHDKVEQIAFLLGVSVEFLINFDPLNLVSNTNNKLKEGTIDIQEELIKSHEHERNAFLQLIERLKKEIEQLRNNL